MVNIACIVRYFVKHFSSEILLSLYFTSLPSIKDGSISEHFFVYHISFKAEGTVISILSLLDGIE